MKFNLIVNVGPKSEISFGIEMEFASSEKLNSAFEFLAQNTDVEWAKIETEERDGTEGHILTTSHEKGRERGSGLRIKRTKPKKVKEHTHNHPKNGNPSKQDLVKAENHPDIEFFIYRKKDAKDYGYEKY